MSPLRAAFLRFAHAARFTLLQNDAFGRFLDEAPPAFALDMFRAMRTTGDFIADLPEPHCMSCCGKPSRSDKGYYTHLAPKKLKIIALCSTCATKKNVPSCTSRWLSK